MTTRIKFIAAALGISVGLIAAASTAEAARRDCRLPGWWMVYELRAGDNTSGNGPAAIVCAINIANDSTFTGSCTIYPAGFTPSSSTVSGNLSVDASCNLSGIFNTSVGPVAIASGRMNGNVGSAITSTGSPIASVRLLQFVRQ